MLGGGFNIHLNVNSTDTTQFKNLLRSHGLYFTSCEPTRKEYCLDSVATNIAQDSHTTRTAEPVIANHATVIFELKETPLVSPSFVPWNANYTFSFRKINQESITRFKELDLNWEQVLCKSDPFTPGSFDTFFTFSAQSLTCVSPSTLKGQSLMGKLKVTNINLSQKTKTGTLLN